MGTDCICKEPKFLDMDNNDAWLILRSGGHNVHKYFKTIDLREIKAEQIQCTYHCYKSKKLASSLFNQQKLEFDISKFFENAHYISFEEGQEIISNDIFEKAKLLGSIESTYLSSRLKYIIQSKPVVYTNKKKSYCYIGRFNLKFEKYGYGFLKEDKTVFEANWIKGNIVGVCRVFYSDGGFYEGFLLIKES